MSGSHDPRIHLAIDNCFASKRWTEPEEWLEIAASLGLRYVEASADTECDPLYHGEEYLERWAEKVLKASADTGVRISSLYSGHGSYATLGLAHTDPAVRRRFLDRWLKPMISLSSRLDAGMGFFCHAFPERVMGDPDLFRYKWDELVDALTELAEFARGNGCRFLALEQMYTPSQVPWTILQAERIMAETFRRKSDPLYITIDTGHMYAQKRFCRPSGTELEALADSLGDARSEAEWPWTGSTDPSEFLRIRAAGGGDAFVRAITDSMEKFDYQFAESRDSDPYEWIRRLGLRSPVIHLQQTNGSASAHLPFTRENNRDGRITPGRLIEALQSPRDGGSAEGLPGACENIYLTFEIFPGKSDYPRDIIRRLRESVAYWREWIPEDGVPLSRLAAAKPDAAG